MDKHVLKAEARKLVGRKVKLLRKKGTLPGNVYGKKIKSESIQVSLADFKKIFKEVGETGLLYLNEKPVLIANIQKDPVTDSFIHVDFHQVDLKEKVEARIPIELTGESPAEKQSIGTVVQYVDEIEVESLPTDLPEKFTIDISALSEVDQAIYVKDLVFDKSKIEVKTDSQEILIKVEPPQKEEVVTPPPAEVPIEGETPTVEGETPAVEGQVVPEEAKPKE